MYRFICLLLLGLFATAPSLAQQSPVGTYKLASLQREIDGKVVPSTGAPSRGYLIITPKVYVLLVTDGTRKHGDSPADRAALWESLTTHGGTYRVEGTKLVMKPDTHSNESFVGREDVRDWQVKGNRLLLATQPRPFSRDPSKIVIARTEWERIE